MIFDKETETRDPAEQRRLDEETYRRQVKYLLERSPFYQQKLRDAGFKTAEDVGGLDNLKNLPFTTKDEIRKSQEDHPPFGNHLAADPSKIVRIFSTSGTTGRPCYIAVTRNDLDVWATNTARSYTAAGFKPGQRIAVAFNAGPFVAGAAYFGFDKMGCAVIPIGLGNTERLVTAIRDLKATGLSCTPSYALYLIDWCREHGIEPGALGIRNIITAGEPGGGDPAIRQQVEPAYGCALREAMGIGDVSLSVWGETEEEGDGMHFSAIGNVYPELIDPESGRVLPWEDGASGELVYTSLVREAMPILRLRSRDHVVVNMKPSKTGRRTPRIRCVGRTDDMLIVRGVNVFPTAIRSVLSEFQPQLSPVFRIKPKRRSVNQDPPLPIEVELGEGIKEAPEGLAEKIAAEIRNRLLVTPQIAIVPYGSIPRTQYKSRLVDYADTA